MAKKAKKKTVYRSKRDQVTTYILGILAVLLVIGGILFTMYPTISDMLSKKNSSTAVSDYQEKASELSEEQYRLEYEKARYYNENLAGDPVHDPYVDGSGKALPKNYEEVLSFDSGIMASIEIPKIKVSLPIFHGTSDDVLQNGVGHIESTALPIGGEGNHAILTGHTGLAKAKLFTDLDKMVIGDVFYIHVLNLTLCYRVDQIEVVLPEDLTKLQPVEGKDYITLLTCTPYGINSHRLLVRGVRSSYIAADDVDTSGETAITTPFYKEPTFIGISIGAAALAILVPTFIMVLIYKYRKKKDKITEAEMVKYLGNDDDDYG